MIAIVINPVLNSCEKHTASLEEEVKVIKANFQNAECITLVRLKHLHPVANSLIFDLQRDTNAIVSIRIRKHIDRAPYCSVCWTLSQERQMTHISRTYHFCYVPNSSVFGTPQTSFLAMLVRSFRARQFESFRVQSNTGFSGWVAHPEHPVFEALVRMANEDQRLLLQELVLCESIMWNNFILDTVTWYTG